MKTASEIFNHYFNQAEIITNHAEFERLVILPAMDEYALNMSRKAFEAARKTTEESNTFVYNTFDEYQQALQTPEEPEDTLRFTLEQIAETILPQYVPADKTITELSFSFNAEGARYQVTYLKNHEGYWVFNNYQVVA